VLVGKFHSVVQNSVIKYDRNSKGCKKYGKILKIFFLAIVVSQIHCLLQ